MKKKEKKRPNRTARLTKKRVAVEIPNSLYRELKERFPGSDAYSALSAIEGFFGVKKPPVAACPGHRVFKCIHPASGTVFTQLTRTEVAKVLHLNRTTLIKHMNKAREEGYKFTSNGWLVEDEREA